MTKLSFDRMMVVARVLNRYAQPCTQLDFNFGVLRALENWIGRRPRRAAIGAEALYRGMSDR